ncbi:MAG: UDP-N-acetylmuramate--L-alanine ligase [Phototrophicaceae bacterium]
MTASIQFHPDQHIHFIGIGGTGISAIARILALRGYRVSGSDLNTNAQTDELSQLGATIYQGHHADYVHGADLLIRSSAIKDHHPEVISAIEQDIPVYKRSDVMSSIMEGNSVVAIAGTHGKTTTTSMTTHVLIETGQKPSYIVGGAMANTGHNADVGQGRTFVIEADEYDNMFHGLKPDIAVITSLEFDHPDFFTTPADLIQSFTKFVSQLPDDGLLICCIDDDLAQPFAQKRQDAGLPVITYGFNPDADWCVSDVRYENNSTLYNILVDKLGTTTVRLSTPGRHNILNSIVALIVAHHENVSLQDAIEALVMFKGTGRRFDIRAEIDDIIIIDDYAHHPTAIKTTLDACRQRFPEHELWAIWQPHTFSRTRSLWADYLGAFTEAQHVIVTEIYASREKADDNPNITTSAFLADLNHPDKYFAETFASAVDILKNNVKSPAIILIMSAGDAPAIGIEYQKILEAQSS